MIDVETIIQLFRHMEWADARVWTAVVDAEHGKGDKKLRDILYHFHLTGRAFLSIWRGENVDTAYQTFEDAEKLCQWARPYYAEVFEYLNKLTAERLVAPLQMPWAELIEKRFGQTPEKPTIGDTALQVVMHSQHHRGQVNARLREIGGEPPLVDYIAWVWLGKPAPEWPEVRPK